MYLIPTASSDFLPTMSVLEKNKPGNAPDEADFSLLKHFMQFERTRRSHGNI